jgi:hypothetical protein
VKTYDIVVGFVQKRWKPNQPRTSHTPFPVLTPLGSGPWGLAYIFSILNAKLFLTLAQRAYRDISCKSCDIALCVALHVVVPTGRSDSLRVPRVRVHMDNNAL